MTSLPSRLKIALLSAGISGVVLAVFATFLGMLIYQMRVASVDREIRSFATRHPGLFAGRANYGRLTGSLEFTFGEDYTNHVIMQLRDARAGTILFSTPWPRSLTLENQEVQTVPHPSTTENHDGIQAQPNTSHGTNASGGSGRGFGGAGPPPAVLFTSPPKFLTAETEDSAWRIGILSNEDIRLIFGLNHDEVRGELDHVRDAFLVTLPVALFLVGLGGWVVAGRALRPLSTIADTAEHVTARGLDQRIPETREGPEIRRVIQVLNRMMDRLEASFRQAIRFSADASHELKTPLAIMQGELENALQAAQPGSPEQQLFNDLLEQIQRLKTITRSLLLLAQADAGQLKLSRHPLNLSTALTEIIEDARLLAAEQQITIEAAIAPNLRMEADQALLHTALFNLLVNAVKYNQAEGKIQVSLTSTKENEIVLTVANTGPVIPLAEQPKIFDRFYRGRRIHGNHGDGMGLGLSLAREIVRAHGGELVLQESRAGWTRFELRIPQPTKAALFRIAHP